MSMPRLAYCQKLWCSFCGKGTAEVEKLIAGPTVFICNECVALCQGILNMVDDEAKSVAFTTPQETRAAEIARGIVAEVLQGSDARIRELMNEAVSSIADQISSARRASDQAVEDSLKAQL